MGNCIVVIHVTGAHHNGHANDIDQRAADFVGQLMRDGHTVSSAKVLTGGEYDLMNTTARFPLRADKPEFYGR
jgi:hypothetical protein